MKIDKVVCFTSILKMQLLFWLKMETSDEPKGAEEDLDEEKIYASQKLRTISLKLESLK